MVRYGLGIFFIALGFEALFKLYNINITLIPYLVPLLFFIIGIHFLTTEYNKKSERKE